MASLRLSVIHHKTSYPERTYLYPHERTYLYPRTNCSTPWERDPKVILVYLLSSLRSIIRQLSLCTRSTHSLCAHSLSSNDIVCGPPPSLQGPDLQFFSAALLSDSEFLEFCPPPLSYINRLRSTGTTNSTYARMPQSVVAWDDFEESTNFWSAIWDSDDNTPKHSHPVFTEFQNMCNKATVQALNLNVFRPLNTVLGEDEVFDRHVSLESVVGEPDFILRGPNQALRLVIEVKTKWVLPMDDLVATYAQNLIERRDNIASPISVYNPLRQIFGYLSHNHLEYGTLTTYDKTWLLNRPIEDPGQLRISPAIRYDNRQPTCSNAFSTSPFWLAA